MKIGDKVKFLRSSNKAIQLTGTIVKISDRVVDIKLDTDHEAYETAHIDDVIVIEVAKEEAKEEEEKEEAKAKRRTAR